MSELIKFNYINVYWKIYRVLKNNVYNVSGMIEGVKTNMLFI